MKHKRNLFCSLPASIWLIHYRRIPRISELRWVKLVFFCKFPVFRRPQDCNSNFCVPVCVHPLTILCTETIVVQLTISTNKVGKHHLRPHRLLFHFLCISEFVKLKTWWKWGLTNGLICASLPTTLRKFVVKMWQTLSSGKAYNSALPQKDWNILRNISVISSLYFIRIFITWIHLIIVEC